MGFDWRPATGELFATDNGRDLLGDDFPPCELNRITPGGFYGWPYANGDNRPDPDFGPGHEDRIATALPPVHGFRAHNAPLGIVFLRSPPAGDAYHGAALVALHGSWNRTRKDGYKVVSLHWDGQAEDRGARLRGRIRTRRRGDRTARRRRRGSGRRRLHLRRLRGRDLSRDESAGEPADGRAPAAPSQPAARDPLASLDPSERAGLAREGRSLWERHRCAGCHEPAAAEPGVVAVPLRELRARHSIESLADFLATPTPPMPVFALDAQERRALAVYLLESAPR